MQRAQRRVCVPLVQVDGRSHQQEGGVGHVHALTHFLIQLNHDGVPAQSRMRRRCSYDLIFYASISLTSRLVVDI